MPPILPIAQTSRPSSLDRLISSDQPPYVHPSGRIIAWHGTGPGSTEFIPMPQVQVRAAVNAQKAEARKRVLTYRGVDYLKQEPTWAPERVSTK